MLQLTVKAIVWKHLSGKSNILETLSIRNQSSSVLTVSYMSITFFEALNKTNLNQNRPRQMTHVEKETNVKRINVHVIHHLSCTHITFVQQPRWQL